MEAGAAELEALGDSYAALERGRLDALELAKQEARGRLAAEAELASESQKARLAREQEKARLQDLLHSVRQEKEVIAAQWARKHEGELAVLHDEHAANRAATEALARSELSKLKQQLATQTSTYERSVSALRAEVAASTQAREVAELQGVDETEALRVALLQAQTAQQESEAGRLAAEEALALQAQRAQVAGTLQSTARAEARQEEALVLIKVQGRVTELEQALRRSEQELETVRAGEQKAVAATALQEEAAAILQATVGSLSAQLEASEGKERVPAPTTDPDRVCCVV
eukprot:COSAG05_NODE_238_length_13155_cov_489.969899_6_plen_289_part_00